MCIYAYVDSLFLFCVLSTFKVISALVPTCDSAHSWQPNSAAPLGDQATTPCPDIPLSHIVLTLSQPVPNLIMPSIWLESSNNQLLCHWFGSTQVRIHKVQIPSLPKQKTNTIYSSDHPVWSHIHVRMYMCIH